MRRSGKNKTNETQGVDTRSGVRWMKLWKSISYREDIKMQELGPRNGDQQTQVISDIRTKSLLHAYKQ